MKGNDKHKDSVFTLLFKDKHNLIELYNAIENTDYKEDVDIQINTLEDILFMDRKNDISFLLDGKFIILLEHQSSINNNLPLRFLIYVSRILEKIIDKENIYKNKLIKIPTPEFITLYNGDKDYPKETILNLSDAFIEPEENFKLELTVRIININYGKNDIIKKSKTLNDYSYFIYKVKENRKQGLTLEESLKKAVNECIQENILKEFLKTNGSEVVNMLFTEWNMEDALRVRGAEEREEGIKEGIKEVAFSLLDILDIQTIAEKTGLSVDEIVKLQNK